MIIRLLTREMRKSCFIQNDVPAAVAAELHYFLAVSTRLKHLNLAVGDEFDFFLDILHALTRIVMPPGALKGLELALDEFKAEKNALSRVQMTQQILKSLFASGVEQLRRSMSSSVDVDMLSTTHGIACICQLLSQFYGASAATQELDLVLSSPLACAFEDRCLQLLWATQFSLLWERFQSDPAAFQAQDVLELYERYLKMMNPAAKSSRVVKNRVNHALMTNDARLAVEVALEEEENGPSQLDIDLFRLCLAAVPPHERLSDFKSI
jgi:hypothetical protein